MNGMLMQDIAYHRNGIGGTGFHVILFRWENANMVAIVFQEPGHVAVLDSKETASGNIAFANGNSWRGDNFEPRLREWITQRGDGFGDGFVIY